MAAGRNAVSSFSGPARVQHRRFNGMHHVINNELPELSDSCWELRAAVRFWH